MKPIRRVWQRRLSYWDRVDRAREVCRRFNKKRYDAGYRAKYNPAKAKAQVQLYKLKHPDKYRAIMAEASYRRRARKAGTVCDLTTSEMREIRSGSCYFCGATEDLTVAHNIPVVAGGNTTKGNVFCLCRSCNSKMHTKTLADVLVQLPLGLEGLE